MINSLLSGLIGSILGAVIATWWANWSIALALASWPLQTLAQFATELVTRLPEEVLIAQLLAYRPLCPVGRSLTPRPGNP